VIRSRWRRLPQASAALLVCLAIAASVAVPARAAAVAPVDKGRRTAERQALAIAQADPAVSSVLAGASPTVAFSAWGGAPGAPAGETIVYRWDAAAARDVTAVWPLLTAKAAVPVPPYLSVDQRLGLEKLTALRVDVLLVPGRVIQIRPLDGPTVFVLREQTWRPFSWFPWLTQNPWVLAPLLLIAAVLIGVRAFLRSRAWRRRLPSMTRHDRQFIGRLLVIVFLVAGLAWQIFESWLAATGPTVSGNVLSAGDLAALPLLIFPPVLFVAAMALEFAWASHRFAWGLLALLALAGSAFSLATALTGTTTNLDLTYYILLGVLFLVALPRAFSGGKTGWSRNGVSRYA
jgi:hypothetical protein